jgi:hypothetical protein
MAAHSSLVEADRPGRDMQEEWRRVQASTAVVSAHAKRPHHTVPYMHQSTRSTSASTSSPSGACHALPKYRFASHQRVQGFMPSYRRSTSAPTCSPSAYVYTRRTLDLLPYVQNDLSMAAVISSHVPPSIRG